MSIHANAGGGNDVLIGGDANGFLVGSGGNDVLTGGGGTDNFTSGAGNDSLLFCSAGGSGDTIIDFAAGSDKINLPAREVAFGDVTIMTAAGRDHRRRRHRCRHEDRPDRHAVEWYCRDRCRLHLLMPPCWPARAPGRPAASGLLHAATVHYTL